MKLLNYIALITVLALSGSTARAQLLGWDFSSAGLGYTNANTGYGGPAASAGNDPGVLPSTITKTGFVDNFSGTNIASPSTGGMSTAFWGASSFASAESSLAGNRGPFTFTVTPASGYTLNLTTLDFGTYYNGTAGTYFIASSLNNYSSPLATFTANGSKEWDAPLNLTITAPITFQIYGYGFGDFNRVGIGGVALADNSGLSIELLGTSSIGSAGAVPEPSTFALLFAGGASLFVIALRRRLA